MRGTLDLTRVTYYHIELAEHGVIFAEGTPAETYLESGNRGAFENGGAPVILHPDFAQSLREQNSYAPFTESGPVVEEIRRQILGLSGLRLEGDPALRIDYTAQGAIIRSRSAIPGEITPDPRDRRVLGVKIAAMANAGAPIPLDHPLLRQGWHDLESNGRWTDGAAIIPAALLKVCNAVTLTLASTMLAYRADIAGFASSHLEARAV